MKRKVVCAVLAGCLLITPSIYSNALAPTSVVRGAIGLEAGGYQFESFDRTRLAELIGQRQGADKDFVIRSVNEVESSFADLINNELTGPNGLYTLSDRSRSTNNPATLEEYLGAKRQFEAASLRIKNKIEGLVRLPSILKDGQHKTDEIEIPQFIKLDFAPIIEYYTNQLEDINSRTSSLEFLVKTPNGAIQKVEGLSFSIEHPYTSADFSRMRKEAAALRVMTSADRKLVDTYNRHILEKLVAFVDTFGTSQKYRKKRNLTSRQETLARELSQAFYSRSLLRSVYGIPLGGIGISYKKRVFDIDLFTNKNQIRFVSESVRSEADMIRIKDMVFYALDAAEKRAGSREDSFADRLANFTTFFNGEVQMAEVNVMVLTLVASDIEEELMLGKPGGLREMRSKYRSDYYNTKESEEKTKALAASFFPEDNEDDIEADVEVYEAESFMGSFRMAKLALENQYDRNYQASSIEATVAQFTKGNTERKKAKRRLNI